VKRICALLLLCSAAGCRKTPPVALQQPQQVLDGFSLSQSYRGNPSWSLQARTAVLKEEDQQAALVLPYMEFYKDKRLVTKLSSLTGTLRTDTYDFRLSSTVVLTSLEDRSVLRTEELDYSSKRRKFLTDKDVSVERPDGTLRGRGLEASPDLSEIRVFNQKTVVKEAER
jgi:LPS export ABC transporter protein LptC